MRHTPRARVASRRSSASPAGAPPSFTKTRSRSRGPAGSKTRGRVRTSAFATSRGIVERALQRLGVDAHVGEVPREYCPGDYSVNARGQTKLAGIGQRLIKGAWHIGGVIVVSESERVRDILVPVYEALGLDWDPATAGAVTDEAPGTRVGRGRRRAGSRAPCA